MTRNFPVITYTTTLIGVMAEHLRGGFFEGWPNPPAPETHLRVLRGSSHVVLAWDEGRVVGFINALSDGVLMAWLPLLEVLPEYRGRGIGGELVNRMLASLAPIYAIDLLCDDALAPYYQRLGLTAVRGMALRDYATQSGLPDTGAVTPS